MTEATLVFKPRTEEHTNKANIAKDYIAMLEDIEFKGYEDLLDLANLAMIAYEYEGDLNIVPIQVAKLIEDRQRGYGCEMSDFDKTLVYELAMHLIFTKSYKAN